MITANSELIPFPYEDCKHSSSMSYNYAIIVDDINL